MKQRIINILLVGNNPTDQESLTDSLDKRGILYHLVCSTDPKEIFDAVESLQISPDIILIDIDLPRINGFELAVILRSNPAYDGTSIFMIGSTEDEQDRRTVEKIGVSGFLVRPLRLESLPTMDVFNLMIDLMNS